MSVLRKIVDEKDARRCLARLARSGETLRCWAHHVALYCGGSAIFLGQILHFLCPRRQVTTGDTQSARGRWTNLRVVPRWRSSDVRAEFHTPIGPFTNPEF